MSIQTFPECECAGFNPECFGVFLNADPNSLNPNDFLTYPVGQGQEIFPALIDTGDMTVSNNIIMTGTPNVNGITFPDNTTQYTAYVPSGALISTTPTTAVSVNQNDYFNQANIVSYPVNARQYTLNAFSGGGHCNAVITQPNVPVNGQPYTNTVYGTSPSGSGITFRNIPIVTPQAANARYAVQIVSQPNLRNPFRNPDGGDRWSGSFSLNVTGPNTITIISTDSNSSVNSIVQGTPFVVNNPPFGCPTSFIVTSILTAGSVYGICIGQGANNPSYYVNQSLLTGFGLQATAIKAQVNASMSGGVVTVSQYFSGIIEAVYEHWIYFPSSNVCYFIPNQTINNPTTFPIVGSGSGSSIASQTAYVYYAFCGTDTYISTWQGSWQRNAILRGAVPVNTVAGGSGGSITLQQDVGTLTTQTPATNGSAGLTQSTQTYPTGLANFTNSVVSNSLALTSSTIGIPSCANSGSWQMLFPPSTYTATALTPAGFGGVEVKFYA